MRKFISWIFVIFWMILIYFLSNQPAIESDKLSIGITEVIVEKVENVTPNNGFIIESINNHFVRKNAHFFIYFVLGLLVINALGTYQIKYFRMFVLGLLICILYALSDEVHQLFVAGRGAQVKDVLIDTTGASVGVAVYLVIDKIIKSTR